MALAVPAIRHEQTLRESPDALARVCAWCSKTLVEGRWVNLRVLPAAQDTTHSICPSCAQQFN